MKLMKILALVAIVALAVPLANAADSKHKFSFFAGYAMPMSDYSESETIGDVVEGISIEADDAFGYGIGYEYRYSERMSFGASLSYWDHDVNATYSEDGETLFDGKIGGITAMPILFDLNFHFLDKLDLYVGPTIGYVMWDDLSLDDTDFEDAGEVPINDAFAYGVNVGLDIPLGENWAISGGLRYLFVDAEIDESDAPSVGIDPLLVTVGVGYKF